MKVNLKTVAAGLALGGAMIAASTPAAAASWRDGHGRWHHSGPQHSYRHQSYHVVSGNHGAYRPGVYHRGCNSWWHWDRARHRNVRVTNC